MSPTIYVPPTVSQFCGLYPYQFVMERGYQFISIWQWLEINMFEANLKIDVQKIKDFYKGFSVLYYERMG